MEFQELIHYNGKFTIVDQNCDFHRLHPVFATEMRLYCMYTIFLPRYNDVLASYKVMGMYLH